MEIFKKSKHKIKDVNPLKWDIYYMYVFISEVAKDVCMLIYVEAPQGRTKVMKYVS